MYQGKHSAQPAGRARRGMSPAHDVTPSRRRSARRHGGRPLALLLALILVVGAAAGGTVAWLTQTTGTANNSFEYGRVSCAVSEDFVGGSTKENVQITNTGNTPAYIRATYVVNWLDKDGNIAASVPEGYSYSLTENPDGMWTKHDDGYFYYPTPVAPLDSTTGSLLTCTAVRPENPEYRLSVEILATAIQSAPASAVETAWSITLPTGN